MVELTSKFNLFLHKLFTTICPYNKLFKGACLILNGQGRLIFPNVSNSAQWLFISFYGAGGLIVRHVEHKRFFCKF